MKSKIPLKAFCLVTLVISLTGCFKQSNTLTMGQNSVQTVFSTASPVTTLVNQSTPVTITFSSSNQQNITNFKITDGLNPLPVDWSQIATNQGNFTCATMGEGNGCQINLKFSPTNISTGILVLKYTYTASNGITSDGSVSLSYQGTTDNNVIYTASPASPLVASTNNPQTVHVDFTTDDNQPATQFQMSIDNLSTAYPGWSSASGTSFECSTLGISGSCDFTLVYTPTSPTSLSSLNLPYQYKDNNGSIKTGDFSYSYRSGSSNSIIATATPTNLYNSKVTLSTPIDINFTTNDQYSASNLSLNLSSLPNGWSSSSSSFDCQNVPVSGNGGCLLHLTYTPTSVISSTVLSLAYTYISNNGQPQNGMVSIPYSAVLPVFAYISKSNNTVMQCAVEPDGNLSSNCTPNPVSIRPVATGFFTANTGITYAYVGGLSPTMLQCKVSASNGTFSECTPINNPPLTSFASTIVFHKNLNQITYAYVTSPYNSTVSICNVNENDGTLTNCNPTGNGFTSPFGISFYTNANNTAYSYVINPINTSTTVSKCLMNQDGTLSSCNTTASFNNTGAATDITTTTSLNGVGYAYLANHSNANSVMSCNINSSNGDLDNCQSPTSSGDFNPYGIAVPNTTNSINNGYLVNEQTIYKCLINSDMNFSDCHITGVSANGSNFSKIAFN